MRNRPRIVPSRPATAMTIRVALPSGSRMAARVLWAWALAREMTEFTCAAVSSALALGPNRYPDGTPTGPSGLAVGADHEHAGPGSTPAASPPGRLHVLHEGQADAVEEDHAGIGRSRPEARPRAYCRPTPRTRPLRADIPDTPMPPAHPAVLEDRHPAAVHRARIAVEEVRLAGVDPGPAARVAPFAQCVAAGQVRRRAARFGERRSSAAHPRFVFSIP